MPSDLQVSNIKDLTGSNTGISIASDGQVTIAQNNPTIQLGTNTTFPTKVTDRDYWYHISESGSTPGRISAYLTSNTLDNSYGVASGCAPKGFTSVVAIKAYFVSSTGPSSWTPISVRFEIGSDGNSREQHAASYNITTSVTFGDDTIRAIDLFNAQDNGSDFEDVVSENDLFGWRFGIPDINQPLYGLGVKITWRF